MALLGGVGSRDDLGVAIRVLAVVGSDVVVHEIHGREGALSGEELGFEVSNILGDRLNHSPNVHICRIPVVVKRVSTIRVSLSLYPRTTASLTPYTPYHPYCTRCRLRDWGW